MPQHGEIFAHCPLPGTAQMSPRFTGAHIQSTLEPSPLICSSYTQSQDQGASQGQAPPNYKPFPQSTNEQAHSLQARTPTQQPTATAGNREITNDHSLNSIKEDESAGVSPSTICFSTKTAVDESNINSTTDPTEKPIDPDDVPAAEIDPSKEVTIHPKGNLILEVGRACIHHPPRKIIVHSNTIENLGPAWVQAISQSERENLFTRRRLLCLPDDDPDMMLVLMWLSHVWHVNKVPKSLSFEQLLAMTRLCTKYDMNLQVAPYIRAWIVPHQWKLLSPGREQWLYVASQFGLEKHYATLARHLVWSCRVDAGGVLLVPGKYEKLVGRIPEEAYNQIRHKRIKALAIFFNLVYKLIDAMENGDSCLAKMPHSPREDINATFEHERTLCTHTNHGELIRYLRTYDYWPPITKSQTISQSVNEIFERLTAIPSIHFHPFRRVALKASGTGTDHSSSHGDLPSESHDTCDVSKVLATMLNDAKKNLEMPMAESTVERVRRNAEKAGLKAEVQMHGYLLVEPFVWCDGRT